MTDKTMMKGHPDAGLKVGDTKEGAGLTWKLYINQYGYFWNAGALGGSIQCTSDGDRAVNPYRIGASTGVNYATFEKAADHAKKRCRKAYDDAKALVAKYEKELGQ